MAKKKITAMIKLQVPAGKATPAPPVGPALGPTVLVHLSSFNSSTTALRIMNPV
jgi:ribosomal protein L11